MTTKAKDGRETLQERLRARINKHIDPRGNVCVGQYNHWDSALDLDAIRDLDAAQAEIARLQAGINKAIDAPLSYNREWILEYLHLVLAENEPAQAPLPARADVVERKDFVALIERIDFERGINECCGHSVGGNSPDEPPSCCAQPERFIPLADVLKAASLLRQPEDPQ